MNLSTAAAGDCGDNKFANILLTNLSTAGAQDCQKSSLTALYQITYRL